MDNCCTCETVAMTGRETFEARHYLHGRLPWVYDDTVIQTTRYLTFVQNITVTNLPGGDVFWYRLTAKIHPKFGDTYHIKKEDSCIGLRYQYDLADDGAVTEYFNPANNPAGNPDCFGFENPNFTHQGTIEQIELSAKVDDTTSTHYEPSGNGNTIRITNTLSQDYTISNAVADAQELLDLIPEGSYGPVRVYCQWPGFTYETYFGLSAPALVLNGNQTLFHLSASHYRCPTGPKHLFEPGEYGGGAPMISRRRYIRSGDGGGVLGQDVAVYLRRGRSNLGVRKICETIIASPIYGLAGDTLSPSTCGLRTYEPGLYSYPVPAGQETHHIEGGVILPADGCCDFPP